MKSFPMFLCVTFCVLGFIKGIEVEANLLYFSNISNIQYYNETGSNTKVVFDNLRYGEALECNLCDHKIYWIELPGMIKRGNPNDPTTVETIISSDLHNPHGLAVDWISNNIYFSHMRGPGHGRIEVAKCDGSHRKVLKHNLMTVGVLAVNPITGHLYYYDHQNLEIKRMNLDGGDIASDVVIARLDTFFAISGIAVDHHLNLLYWAEHDTDSHDIMYLNMTEWNLAHRLNDDLPQPSGLSIGSNPYEIAIINSTLYWTELREVNEDLISIGRPGAIYTMNSSNSNITKLIESRDLSPHDLCFFYDHFEVPAGGCADDNGGCELFCFSVPNNNGDGTRVQCGCPTGILLKEDNSCNLFPDNYLVFTQVHNAEVSGEIDRTDIRMLSLDISGQYIDVLMPIDLRGTESVFIAYDQVDHRVYWTELDPPAIMSAYIINGTDKRVLINSSISRPESLAIDHFARNLYWIDSGLNKIEVVRLDSSHTRKVLFNSDLSHPQGLALDALNANMYWTDLDQDVPRVERARMDGTERMVLPGVTGDIKQPSNIAVDPLTRQVYWSDTFPDNEKIVRYDGERDNPLGILQLSDVLGLAVHGSYIYWTDRGNSRRPLGRADKRSGENSEALLENVSGFHGLVAVNKSADPGSNGCTHFQVSADQLCLPTGNGSHSLTCADHFILDSNNHCQDVPLVAFIATEESILQVKYATDASTGHENWKELEGQALDISGATALDVDVMDNKIYWINSNDKRIYRTSINSTESDGVECVVCCCLSAPEDIAVDWYGRNLYWTDSDLGVIEISKLDGSQRSIFALIPEEFGAPSVIKVDPLRGKLYWAPKSRPAVYETRMADLTADSPPEMRFTTLWDGSSSEWNRSTVVNIALNYSRSTGNSVYLYWAVTTNVSAAFYKKNLDDPQDNAHRPVETKMFPVFHLEVFGDSVYFHKKTFRKHNIVNDDTNNFVFGDTAAFMDITFMHHSLQPGIHECSVNNGDCGGKSLCLVADGVTGVCSCPTLLLPKSGQLNQNTFQDCIAVDTFLLIATKKSVSYAPVPVDGSSTTSRRLPIGPVGNIQAIAYDPVNRSVVWIDSVSDTIQSVAVNGSAQWEYSIPSGIETFSMAYDYFGGQMFVTETTGFQIELLTLNGESVGSLLRLDDNPLFAQKPGEIVFDDENSYLYWTNRSVNDGYGEAIHRMSLDNLRNVQTIDIGQRRIEKLTLDWPFLYWIDRKTEGAYKIERINLNSTNSNPNVTVIATSANNVTALAATTINSKPHVFWFNETDRYIYRHNENTTGRYFMWRAPDAVIAILGYTRKQLLLHKPCLSSTRPCSHLCLRDNTAEGYRCACPPSSDSQSNPANCSSHVCAALQLSCDDEFGGCYPRAYRCDGIRHCRNGTDERNCPCVSTDQFTCFNSESRNECVSHHQRCDGTDNCKQGEDEEYCCMEPMFGCYVDVSDRHDSFGGAGEQRFYQCLEPMARCDGVPDCVNQTDEMDCPTTMTSSSPETSSGPLEGNILIVIIVTIVVIIVMVVLLVGVCITVRWMHKKKQEYDMNQAMIRANNMSMGGYKSHSPPFRSESQSDYCSEMSGGTHTTQLGNGSNNMSPSGDTCFKYRTADPPPPSPDALTEIEDDDISRISQPISEYTVPIPPCPSINYDALSGNMSFSVSQSQFPGTITSHYNAIYNPRFGVNGRNLGGNRPNPLLIQQQSGNPYYHPANHVSRPQHIHPNSGKNMPTSNGTSKYADRNYPPAPHYRQNVYSRKEQLDSEAQSETESTLSMNIDNTPDVFEENLPRPPPGRPPSPATLCSEYPGVQLMSPETGSTLSDSSDDC